MLFFDPRYKLKYVKFWFKIWYGKDKGDAMSSRVQDVLKRLREWVKIEPRVLVIVVVVFHYLGTPG